MKRFLLLLIPLFLTGCMRLSFDFEMGTTDTMAVSRTKSETVSNNYNGNPASVEFVREVVPVVGDVVDRVTPLPDRPVVVAPPENAPPETPVIVVPPESEGGQSLEDILDGTFGQGG